MAYAVKEKEILERALRVIKKEFAPVDYVRFLSAISARRGDAARELRKLRDVVTEEELDMALKKRGAKFV
jgi:ribosomal protein S21